MKFLARTKRKKIEIKPIQLSYYSHNSEPKTGFPFKFMSRKLKNGLKIVMGFLLIGLLIPLVYYLFTEYDFFQVKKIEVFGENKYVLTNEVQNYVKNKVLDKSMLGFKPTLYANEIKRQYTAAQDIQLQVKWPDKVVVTIIERIPVAVVSDGSGKFLVDKEGYVMAALTEATHDYPEISYQDKISVGTFIHQNIVPESIKLIDLARDANLVINHMQFNSQYITLTINDTIEVDLSLAKENLMAMKQVRAIIEKSASEGLKLRKVDLRFEKVIVLYD